MALLIDIQNASSKTSIPNASQFSAWLNAAAQKSFENYELCLRIVDDEEMIELNHQYRHKNKVTNVLSFPADLPEGVDIPLLGDIVICAGVVEQEAEQQNKTLDAHWAHLCVHGMLHLQGYDHIEDNEAEIMEALEITILKQLGYNSPYDEDTI